MMRLGIAEWVASGLSAQDSFMPGQAQRRSGSVAPLKDPGRRCACPGVKEAILVRAWHAHRR